LKKKNGGKKEDHYDNYFIIDYYGITQDPITKDFMLIMNYYESGDLHHYIRNDFYNIDWYNKLSILRDIIRGLDNIHNKNIIIRDFHSGNILYAESFAVISDLGISKSMTESTDNDNNEIYGILTHIAPEIFQGKKYTTASDIYSFGMIMWELMTGRMPFWDRYHDTDLIIEICDGTRPPIVTDAPVGYIELMQECWYSDPNKRPTAAETNRRLLKIIDNERENPTNIIESSDIGPITNNDPGAIYKSRSLSDIIKSSITTVSLKSQSIVSELEKQLIL